MDPGKRYVIANAISPFMLAAILFIAAGSLDIPRAWAFFAISFVYLAATSFYLAKNNPELAKQRMEWNKRKDTLSWDRFLIIGYGLFQFYIQIIVIGLDMRYGWTGLGWEYGILGFLLLNISQLLLFWSMAVNSYFETTVRIQKEKNQVVVTAGPYRYVRHPGYLGVMLWALSPSLFIGSAAGLIPAIIAVALLAVRTKMEDGLLMRELPGYPEYAKKVRYMLLPLIW